MAQSRYLQSLLSLNIYMHLLADPFVTIEWLKNKLETDASGIRLLDCQWHMPQTKRVGLEEYKQKHIPGAQFFDLEECADKNTDIDHMLPKPEFFADYVGKLGINNNTHIVLYDNHDKFGLFSAQRVWWTFRAFGHDNNLISIVNGGFPAWLKAGFEATDVVPTVEAEKYTANYKGHLVKSMDEVRAILKEQKTTVVDARPTGRYEGTAPEPREGIKQYTSNNICGTCFRVMTSKFSRTWVSQSQILHIIWIRDEAIHP